tara:strand:- start:318 stop:710 length:393 start_codon:yes stop_codon:yes gene_type:complete
MAVSTDAQLRTRSHLCDEALAAINAQRTRRSLTAATLTEFRSEAYRLILIALRSREPSIEAADITRPDDLIDAECAGTLALLFGAASSRSDDVFALAAAWWQARHDSALASASPIDGVRGTGRSFSWSRG